MGNEIAVSRQFSLAPANLSEAFEFAKMMADSDMVPKDYRGKPGNVLIAVQMGQEVGLQPMAAIQNIAVINGKPGLYGDAGKAILLAAGLTIEEDDIKDIKANGIACCTITRNGKATTRTYGIDNAKTAKLWGKDGPWSTNPERQMAWRAFWFAARDSAADLLKGLGGAEELRDITERDMGTAEVVGTRPAKPTEPSGPPELPVYPDDKFETNLPTWKKLVEAGTKTVDAIGATISTKNRLTDEQVRRLRELGQKSETSELMASPEQIADIRAKAEAAAVGSKDICNMFDLASLDAIPATSVDAVLDYISNPAGE